MRPLNSAKFNDGSNEVGIPNKSLICVWYASKKTEKFELVVEILIFQKKKIKQ